MPESTINALASQAFNVMNKQGRVGFESSLTNLGVVLSKMMSAKAAADRVKLEKERLELERKRFDELKLKELWRRRQRAAAGVVDPSRSTKLILFERRHSGCLRLRGSCRALSWQRRSTRFTGSTARRLAVRTG